jgi:hypothetical protein
VAATDLLDTWEVYARRPASRKEQAIAEMRDLFNKHAPSLGEDLSSVFRHVDSLIDAGAWDDAIMMRIPSGTICSVRHHSNSQ